MVKAKIFKAIKASRDKCEPGYIGYK